MNVLHKTTTYSLLAAAMMFCFIPAGYAAEGARRELRLGVISAKPEKMLSEYSPMADYISVRLNKFGIKAGIVIVKKDVEEMLEAIRDGKVDMVFESAFSTVIMEKAGMLPSILMWRKGVREYRTLFFVRKDSPLRELKDLSGRTIVLEDPRSTSAFAIPMAEMKRIGLNVLPLRPGEARADAVTYALGGEELNQAFWVIQKKADAAAFNNNDWDELPAKVRDDLRIIHETPAILRYVVSFHPAFPASLRVETENIFVNMDRTPEGRGVLNEASRTRKMERLTERDIESLGYMRKLLELLN